jgi:Arc/MetJ family transcription regulator
VEPRSSCTQPREQRAAREGQDVALAAARTTGASATAPGSTEKTILAMSSDQSWKRSRSSRSAAYPLGPTGAGRREERSVRFRCMKRTNLVLREDLLEEATRLSGEKTYSRAVERALEDFVRRAKARRILELRGSGLWEGDLSAMRRDAPAPRRRRRRP